MQNNRVVGTKYEKMAGEFLERKGYKILAYNYRCPIGEIDIVAKYQDELVFVEVKYRKNISMGDPLEAITLQKRRILSKCARYYLVHCYRYEIACRFDVIGIIGVESNGIQVNHLESAFESIG